MPPQRTPLGLISGNRLKNFELSPYQRGQITGGNILGYSPAVIALGLNLPKQTVWNTIRLDELRVEGASQQRTGRPKGYTAPDERAILRHARLFPKHTYLEVIQATGVEIKRDTVKRILKQHGITNWRAKRRPELTEVHAAKRLAWCLRNRHRRPEEWGMYMWSDECSIERGRGKQQKWCFRTPVQK